MKRNMPFRSIEDVLNSMFGSLGAPTISIGSNRVFKSTRLEDKIYADLRQGDGSMEQLEEQCTSKLSTFSALPRDVYQSFYSLSVRQNDEDDLSDLAKRFNSPILRDMMSGEDYPTIKSVCEGRQLPAYEAASEFMETIAANLDNLLEKAGGEKGALNTLEKAQCNEEQLQQELSNLLQRREQQGADPELDRRIVDKANRAASKERQIEAISGQIRDNMVKNGETISAVISQATQAAQAKAEETALTMSVWGQGEDNVSPKQLTLNRDILDKVRQNTTLLEITSYLGRFKEMVARTRKNSYAHGRGEKYALELGNNLQRVLTSEFSALAIPAATSLFLRKYQNRRLQQYKRREAIFKGCGDIIMCLDESSSARGEAAWGKAVALTLLDMAMAGRRKFALIHFSSEGKFQTNLFLPGKYDAADVFTAAETFLGGNTDYETPLKEALRLIMEAGFDNADIVFTTDGICSLPEAFQRELKERQVAHGFKITGILLDITSPGMMFSLEPFCDEIFRTSEFTQDKIVEALINKRV